MKTIRLLAIIAAGIFIPFVSNAQLGKLMNEFHGSPCVTITQLDKALYGLYKNDHLPPDVEKMLQQLDEVNFLNLDLNECNPDIKTKVIKKFQDKLNVQNEYKLIKSMTEEERQQLIYAKTKDSKVTDLVVWNQNRGWLDIIELKGNIQLDKIANLSKALSIKGLNSLSALNPGNDRLYTLNQFNNYKGSIKPMKKDMKQLSENLKKMSEKIREQGKAYASCWNKDSINNDWENRFYNFPGGNLSMDNLFPFEGFDPEEFFQSFENINPDNFWGTDENGVNIISNAVEITEENGKTKIKVDAQNSDIIYIIDGKECKDNNVIMPERIKNLYIQRNPKDMKKSYLFIISKDKIGQFVSNKDGILNFKYDGQDYKFNLNKSQSPLLIINGQPVSQFTINPESILQIRPISQIEKETGKYKTAEVFINTK